MTQTGRHIPGLALAVAFAASTPALADLSSALDACLDHGLDIAARAEVLESAGWVVDPEADALFDARTHAIVLTRMSGFDDSSWATLFMQAKAMAEASGFGSEGSVFLTHNADTLTLEKNATGLQTCLFVGKTLDLSPVQTVLDGKGPSKAGVIQRLRGETFRALVTAHSIDPDTARTGFPEPLTYHTTFSVVLDRTEGS